MDKVRLAIICQLSYLIRILGVRILRYQKKFIIAMTLSTPYMTHTKQLVFTCRLYYTNINVFFICEYTHII